MPSLDAVARLPALTTIDESLNTGQRDSSKMDEETTTADRRFRPLKEIDIKDPLKPHAHACESLIPNHSDRDRVKFSWL